MNRSVPSHAAFLRGINVGGNKKVAMSELRDLFTELGFADPHTLLQSGNIVFGSKKRPGIDLESLIEAEIFRTLKVSADVMVRTADQVHEAVSRNPFEQEAVDDPSHLVVYFLKGVPDGNAVESLEKANPGTEQVRAAGTHLYVTYPSGIGVSKLTIQAIERGLGVRGTGRNWNTVMKVAAMMRD